jgi:predicted TPR repeat methyltransferase
MPTDTPARLLWEAENELRAGRLVEAAQKFGEALAIDPDMPGVHHNLGNIFASLGRWEESIAGYQAALSLDPAHAFSHYAMAGALRAAGRFEQSIVAYREALRLGSPAGPQVGNDLGATLLHLGHAEEAAAVLKDAAARAGGFPEPHRNLAMALLRLGRAAEAVKSLESRLKLEPGSWRAHHELGTVLAQAGRPGEAVGPLRRAIAMEPGFGPAYCNLALALEDLHERGEAIEAMREAARLDPDSHVIGYHLAALTGERPPAITPPRYLVELFDGYADRFDEHLVRELDYRGAELVCDAVTAAWRGGGADVIDLGCGTGLCGVRLRPVARRLIGVDLTPRMIEKARSRGVYDALWCLDIVEALRTAGLRVDVVVAADVFIYVGELAPVFEAAAGALRPGGLLAFTIERAERGDYVLLPSRRYAQSPGYVRGLAESCGFDLILGQEATLRAGENGLIQGVLMVLRRNGEKPPPPTTA